MTEPTPDTTPAEPVEQSDADLLAAEQDHFTELCFQAVES